MKTKQKKVQLNQIEQDENLQVRKRIDPWVVSRLVQVLKSGNEFVDRIVILPDGRIVAGFHRLEAYKKVFDPYKEVKVLIYYAEDEKDAYQYAVKSNIANGEPLRETEKLQIRENLHRSGWSDAQISQFLGVSLERFQQWDANQVIVSGDDGKEEVKHIKRGTKVTSGRMTKEQYNNHLAKHSVTTTFHALKIMDRIKDGTLEEDNQTLYTLFELYDSLGEVLNRREVI